MRILSLLILVSFNFETFAQRDKVEYHKNGNIKSSVTLDSSNCYHGTITTYFKNGRVKSQITYVNGYIFGKTESFWRNGNKRAEGFLDATNSLTLDFFRLKPTRVGPWTKWSRSGNKETSYDLPSYPEMADEPISKCQCD
ncbi:MAG: hypothetical protein MRY83_20090 [Flavobacteriales bacterium]|nr:hypothetical protein [Flavobacteriales bacterium]